MYSVVIFQHRLVHYRTRFFELLRGALLTDGIRLTLVHGQPSPKTRGRNDAGQLDWATPVENVYVGLGDAELCIQPIPVAAWKADLIVLGQENRILSNYPILASRYLLGKKVAWWGHGVNFQSDRPDSLRERWKRLLLTRVDWWFAYTEATCKILREAGFPEERTTCLNNAIDTSGFRRDLDSVSDSDVRLFRSSLGIGEGDPVGLFCGALYPEKGLDFLFEAAEILRQRNPGFHLIVVGDGPVKTEVDDFVRNHPWCHALGAKRGGEKALAFRSSNVLLNPRLVGLHIVDAFTAGLPLCTTSQPKHGPEIAYLEPGVNGVMSADSPELFADEVDQLLQNEAYAQRMRENARASAEKYSIENMVAHFADGVRRCVNK